MRGNWLPLREAVARPECRGSVVTMAEQVADGVPGGPPGQVSGAKRDSGRGFRPDIQGVRALAVTMVVIYHLYPSLLPGGYVGVDVFFVVSGFLITGQLWHRYQRYGRVHLLDFWGRRARRLLPAAALVLAVVWVASYLMLPATRLSDTANQIRASALYFQNWQLASNAVNYLKSADAATPVVHFWSLSVEEQFYLIWPLLFAVAAISAARYRRVVLGGLIAALVAGSLAYSVYETRVNPRAAYFVTTTRMWELGTGGLLALLPGRVDRVLRRQGWLGWAGLALVAATPFLLSGTSAFPGTLALLPVGGAALLIAGGSDRARLGPARLMSLRPMVFLGGISYSLYLWHWPVIDLWTAHTGKSAGIESGLALIGISVVLAWLTKILVEDTVRGSRRLAGHPGRSLSMVLAAALPVTLASVYLAGVPGQWNGKLGPGYPGAAVLARTVSRVPAQPVLPPLDDRHAAVPEYWQQGCLAAPDAIDPKVCVYGDTASPVLTVALVGDSIAGNWFPALEKIALRYHWKLVTDLHGTCPWTATLTANNSTRHTSCQRWGAAVLHGLLTSIRPDVVITSDLPGEGTVTHPQPGPAAFAQIGAGMAQYWTQLEDHGISVVAIRETPMMGFSAPECVARYGASSRKCDKPAATAIRHDPPTVQAARRMAGKVGVIDMNKFVCGPKLCPSVIGNVLVYFDGHHMTSSYSQTLAPYLAPRLFRASAVLASHQ